MKFAHIFIDRPRLAAVLSIVLVIIGLVAAATMPVAQYPEIAPPTIVVTANYPGADAETVGETVATPIEQEVNGVENMLYMSSQSTSDGQMKLTVTFKLGTNLDIAQVLVQNRVSLATPKLPEDVRRLGITTKKSSPSILQFITVLSPDGSRDQTWLSNYVTLQIKDRIARVYGVGDLSMFGTRDYSMRIWLDPEKLSARSLTAQDVVSAVQEQNVQVAAGIIGQEPTPKGTALQLTVNTKGRLQTEADFGAIVVKAGSEGRTVRLRDIATVRIEAKDYNTNFYFDGKPCIGLSTYQLPGSSAVAVADAVKKEMALIAKDFPPGVTYQIPYDTTVFVKESIHEVFKTLFEAIILVGIVVLLFLQTWRATLIPLLAVPVSIIGTFAAMAAMGFSLNNISLFGIVLAIGIVVDDAIVVVENVEHWMAKGLSPRDATRKAMDEVSGPVIAIALVLSAVFVPTVFIPGISGQFFKQFAATIAVSTIISAFNSLTLSPALAAILLQPHGAKKDPLGKLIDIGLGWFFKLFNKTFDVTIAGYGKAVHRLCRLSVLALIVYGGLLYLTGFGFSRVPVGFIPPQDKGYAMGNVQLPDAASLQRADEITTKIAAEIKEVPGVAHVLATPGMSFVTGAAAPNVGGLVIIFEEFEHRLKHKQTFDTVMTGIRGKLAGIRGAVCSVFGAPPVDGLGSTGGFKIYVQDRQAAGFQTLQSGVANVIRTAQAQPMFKTLFSSFRATEPQIFLDIDREKAKAMGVPLSQVFSTLSVYLGSAYINDLTLFGRSFQVKAQADSLFRAKAADVPKLKTRNASGDMVPLGAVLRVEEKFGPTKVLHYNIYPAAEISGEPATGVASGDVIRTIETISKEALPQGMGFEWTEIYYQQILAGNAAVLVFPFCVLMVFLILAAQYESWALPFSIILIVPMSLLASITGVAIAKLDNNIFTQIGFVVLVGLATKNAILIVEFAKQIQDTQGKGPLDAVVEACKLRLRPILMTSFAFILGVVPLMIGKGAGAEMRNTLGVAVFSGMLGVTIFGIFLTPVFYFVIVKLFMGKTKPPEPGGATHDASAPQVPPTSSAH